VSITKAMAFRIVPVVYKGYLSGSSVDIVDGGRYSVDFRSVDELAEVMEAIDYVMIVSY
jgi:hypothetical protein